MNKIVEGYWHPKTSRYRLLTDLVNRALTSVNLSGNDIRTEGAKAVAGVLPQCKYVV